MNTNPININLPIITNIREAKEMCHTFPAVITAGPTRLEVMDFKHPNHFVRTFDDIPYGTDAPTVSDVEAMLAFASDNDGPILVHCHAGMSRSTGTAWGIAIQRGCDPFEAYDMLKNIHPTGRMFYPNEAIVAALEKIFDLPGLTDYNDENHYLGESISLSSLYF